MIKMKLSQSANIFYIIKEDSLLALIHEYKSRQTDKESSDKHPLEFIAISKPELNYITFKLLKTIVMLEFSTLQYDVLHQRIHYFCRYFIFSHSKAKNCEYYLE